LPPIAVRLPKQGYLPVIGGRVEEPFACIYIAAPPAEQKPVKLGYCLNHDHLVEKLAPFKLVEVFWVPDLNLAKRLMHGAYALLRAKERELSDGSFDTTAKKARSALVESASFHKIPMCPNRAYLKMCKSPAERRRAETDRFLQRLGWTESYGKKSSKFHPRRVADHRRNNESG